MFHFQQMSMDVPYHPPPEHMGQTSPYSDLKSAELPVGRDWSWKMRHGIIDVKGITFPYDSLLILFLPDEENNAIRFVTRPDTLEFLDNHAHLLSLMSQGTLRTYCWRRLQFLSHKFHLHALLNENLEVRYLYVIPWSSSKSTCGSSNDRMSSYKHFIIESKKNCHIETFTTVERSTIISMPLLVWIKNIYYGKISLSNSTYFQPLASDL